MDRAAELGARARQLPVLVPGLVLTSLIALAGYWLADLVGTGLLGFARSPISPVMVSLLLGLVLGNVLPDWAALKPGVGFAVKKVLRLGIILLGMGLSVLELFRLGLYGLPVVVVCIAAAILLTSGLNRLLRLPARLGSLIAVGTSICGVSAIVAIAPAIEAREEEVTYAVAVITVFGLLATALYPYLAERLFVGDPVQAGLFLGTSVHDTSQVTGAALVYADVYSRPEALSVATVTKLVRNVLMAAVIPLLAWVHHRASAGALEQGAGAGAAAGAGTGGTRGHGRRGAGRIFPLFILGFVALAAFRSLGDWTARLAGRPYASLSEASWAGLIALLRAWSVRLIVVALAGVGLSTRIATIRVLGWKPFLVGLGAAVSVGGVSTALILLMERYIRM